MTDRIAVPVPEVDAVTITSVSMGDGGELDILTMFLQADMVVKLVILGLLFASFWSWAIIIDKFLRFRTLNRRTNRFEQAFWSGELLEKLYDSLRHGANHPMAMIFVAAMDEWKRKIERPQKPEHTGNFAMPVDYTMKVGMKERIFQAMSLTRNKEVGGLEKNLGFLATVGSTAPFVGLFGTVWGIMNSFQSIALAKNSTLAVVAPGIAEALLATAIGLLAAIPAVIFYNKFTNDLSRFAGRLDSFADEFESIISRELDGR